MCCIAGNFQGVQFLQIGDFYYFANLIFAVSRLSSKTTKIGPLENSCYHHYIMGVPMPSLLIESTDTMIDLPMCYTGNYY